MAEETANPGDEQLLDRVRAGDSAAYETLYREHVDDAERLGRILVGPVHADELVAESFAKVLAALRNGGGPTGNFRAYLHVTIRNGYRDELRATTAAPVSDQPWLLDDIEPSPEEMVEGLDETVAVDALSSLPESWQRVLWHVEVEGRKPAEVARLMKMRPGAVSSLTHRAREGLKRAYLDLHTGPEPAREACRWTHARMGQYVRSDLGTRARQRFDDHVAGCDSCRSSFLAVDVANRRLAGYVLPIVLLGGAAGSKGLLMLGLGGVAAAGGAAGAASGGTSTGGGGSSLGSTLAGAATGPAGILAAAAVALSLAAVGAFTLIQGHDRQDAPPSAAANPGRPDHAPRGRAHGTTPEPKPTRSAPPTYAPPASPVQPVAATSPESSPPASSPTPAQPGPTQHNQPPSGRRTPVTPERPTQHPVSACESEGSLDLPSTVGVHYALTRGDGRTGPWTVSASAERGYVIAAGAPTTFSGDLGRRYPCTALARTTTTQRGRSVHWDIQADVDVLGGPDRVLTLRFDFDRLVTVNSFRPGVGWRCTSLLLGPLSVRCTFAYTGTPPPPVTVSAQTNLLGRQVAGRVSLTSAGEQVGTRSFG